MWIICVRVGIGVSSWFRVRVGLRKGCVMSPWLFNIYMDGVVMKVNVRMLGIGLSLVNADCREWNLSCLQMIRHLWLIQKGGSERWWRNLEGYVKGEKEKGNESKSEK